MRTLLEMKEPTTHQRETESESEKESRSGYIFTDSPACPLAQKSSSLQAARSPPTNYFCKSSARSVACRRGEELSRMAGSLRCAAHQLHAPSLHEQQFVDFGGHNDTP